MRFFNNAYEEIKASAKEDREKLATARNECKKLKELVIQYEAPLTQAEKSKEELENNLEIFHLRRNQI